MMTVVWIICGVLAGGLLGWAFLPVGVGWLGDVITGALCFLVFFAGMDVGHNWDVMKRLVRRGYQILVVPFVVVLGSMIGGVAASFLFDMDLLETLLVISGMGWYSLSGPVITEQYHMTLGTVAFISNLMREILSFVFIPLAARYMGFLPAVGLSGAPSMDSALPIIIRFTNSQYGMIAFFCGVVLTLFVPLMLQFFIGILAAN